MLREKQNPPIEVNVTIEMVKETEKVDKEYQVKGKRRLLAKVTTVYKNRMKYENNTLRKAKI